MIIMQKKLIIAIDGPSASGKGTIAKLLSKKFNIPHLDTGALYRAVAYISIKNNLNLDDLTNTERFCEIAKKLTIEDINNPEIRTEQMGAEAAKIAKVQAVRDVLLQYQRDFANQENGAVLDGRDIGTVICPNAKYKFFITASAEERANRRFKDEQNRKTNANYEEILQKLKDRDEKDMNRTASPFKKADDAILIDTTGKTVEEIFNYLLSVINK